MGFKEDLESLRSIDISAEDAAPQMATIYDALGLAYETLESGADKVAESKDARIQELEEKLSKAQVHNYEIMMGMRKAAQDNNDDDDNDEPDDDTKLGVAGLFQTERKYR